MTTEEFNSTPLVIGPQPTTYGELRDMVATTTARTEEEWIGVLLNDPILLINACRGMANGIKHLLDEIERLTNANETENAA